MIGTIQPIDPAPFDYAALVPDDAEFLRNQAAYINARRHITHQLITEMGRALGAAKKRLPGVFLQWARAEFGFSDDTIENYMNVAQRFPALEPQTDGGGAIQARALYLLSRTATSDDARTEAARLAGAGQVVDYQTAFILAEAPAQIKTRYLKEELPKQAAYDLAKTYSRRTLPQPVRDVCITQNVSYPEVIAYLAKTYIDYQQTKGTPRERRTWLDIEADNWQLNGLGWSVPLGQARPVDISRYVVDRAAMHRDLAPRRFQWLQTDSLVEQTPDGRYILILEKPEFKNLNGQLLTVQIRLPIEESS